MWCNPIIVVAAPTIAWSVRVVASIAAVLICCGPLSAAEDESRNERYLSLQLSRLMDPSLVALHKAWREMDKVGTNNAFQAEDAEKKLKQVVESVRKTYKKGWMLRSVSTVTKQAVTVDGRSRDPQYDEGRLKDIAVLVILVKPKTVSQLFDLATNDEFLLNIPKHVSVQDARNMSGWDDVRIDFTVAEIVGPGIRLDESRPRTEHEVKFARDLRPILVVIKDPVLTSIKPKGK